MSRQDPQSAATAIVTGAGSGIGAATTIVTGTSSGIAAATAREHARTGYGVVLAARRDTPGVLRRGDQGGLW